MSKHTPGPLMARISNVWPFDFEVVDVEGRIVFSERMPCHSSRDMGAEEALTCRNFPLAERAECAEANARAFADVRLRAAAPMLLLALKTLCAADKRGELDSTMFLQAEGAIKAAEGEA